jgi:hypothetical protein
MNQRFRRTHRPTWPSSLRLEGLSISCCSFFPSLPVGGRFEEVPCAVCYFCLRENLNVFMLTRSHENHTLHGDAGTMRPTAWHPFWLARLPILPGKTHRSFM